MKKGIVVWFMLLFMVLGTATNAEAASFKDINKNTSLFVEVNYLMERGIINGYPDGTFKPDEPIAKKHIALMLVRALKLPTTGLKNPNYKDVPTTHPYYKEIAAGYTAGLFAKADYFNPDLTISREVMARLIAKALKLEVLPGTEGKIKFSDVSQMSQYYTDILKVASNNVVKGYGDGTFKPRAYITRAHFAAFLARAMTIKVVNISPDSNYVYYYTDGKKTYRQEYNQEDANGIAYWKVVNETSNKSNPKLGFKQDLKNYGEAYEGENHFSKLIPYPFVVTQIHSNNEEGPVSYGNSWILDTAAVRTVHNVKYTNVLVVETYLPWDKTTKYEYYAKDIGLIQIVDKNGKELYGLVKRKAIK